MVAGVRTFDIPWRSFSVIPDFDKSELYAECIRGSVVGCCLAFMQGRSQEWARRGLSPPPQYNNIAHPPPKTK